MKANWLPLSVAVALALSSVAASAVEFHGYARAGMQANTKGGNIYCSGTGERGHKAGRLGDECDTYAELTLNQEIYNKANNKWTLNTLFALGTYEASDDYRDPSIDLQGNSWQGTGGTQNRGDKWPDSPDDDAFKARGNVYTNPWGGLRVGLRELWTGYQTDAGYQIWAGKRYYQRKDIHLLDLYYLNNSGYGAGIEGIDVGMGNLAFAVTKWANDSVVKRNPKLDEKDWGDNTTLIPTNRNVYKLDARWNGIPVGFGTIDAAVIYALPFISDHQRNIDGSSRSTQANSGVLATLEHNSTVNTDSVSLMNKFIVQYGTNGFGYVGQFKNHAGDNYTPDIDIQGVRLIDWGTLDVGNFGLGYSLLWGHINVGKDHNANGNNAWTYDRSGWEYSVVLRPEYKWTEFTRTTLELGYSKMKATGWVAATGDDDPDAYKVTLAQQFTPGKGFWTRPAIRFYVSYLGGTQLSKGNLYFSAIDGNWTAGKAFKDANDGHNYQVTVGTQVEAWW